MDPSTRLWHGASTPAEVMGSPVNTHGPAPILPAPPGTGKAPASIELQLEEARAARRRAEEATRNLNAFATSLSGVHSVDDIVWEVTRQGISTLGFEDCVVYLVDESRHVLVQRAAFGPKNPRDREIAAPIEIRIGCGIVGAAAETARTQRVDDTRTDTRYVIDDAFRLSELAVPIVSEGRTLGVIDSEHSEAAFFTDQHVAVLESIAAICAHKILRARTEARLLELNQELERRITERTAELVATNTRLTREIAERTRAEAVQRALFEISEAAHAAVDLPRLYPRIHEIISTLMPADNFYIALQDEATGMVSFPYFRDAIDPPPAPRKARRGMTEYVLRSGRASLADLHEIQRLKEAGEYAQTGHPSAIWLGVPLTARGRTFGVMAVQDHHRPNVFGEEEKRILSFVAGQTALTVDRKRAEAELRAHTDRLRESEERFSKAFRAIPAIVSLVRAHDERLIEVNEAFVQSSGFTHAEAIGRSTAELGLWANADRRREFFDLLRAHGSVRGFEARLLAKSGRIEEAILSAELLEIDREPVVLALALVVTERKRAEEELLRALARERELSRLKSSFVALVSHEFRTPLGVIHSSAEILDRYLDRLDPAERREHLKAIQQQAWRMAALLEEVLVFGRVEAGRLEFHPTSFDLFDACRRWTDEQLRATENRCPILIESSLLPEPAQGDPDLLRHVVSNLLSNAVKYSPAGRPVVFRISRDGAQAVLEIEDQGMGIPPDDHPRLFNAFQRGSNVRQVPGSGLGLVVIRHCLDLHGGTISLASQEGLGTCAQVRVPLFPKPTTTPPPRS